MPANKEIEELIDFVKSGGWVKGHPEKEGNYIVRGANKIPWKESYYPSPINNLKWKELELEYLAPLSESTKEQILSLLSGLRIGESDEEAIMKQYPILKYNKSPGLEKLQETLREAVRFGLTQTRLKMQAEIKALEEKVAKRDEEINCLKQTIKSGLNDFEVMNNIASQLMNNKNGSI